MFLLEGKQVSQLDSMKFLFLILVQKKERSETHFNIKLFFKEPKVFSKIKTKKNSPPKFARHAAATVDTKIYMFGG